MKVIDLQFTNQRNGLCGIPPRATSSTKECVRSSKDFLEPVIEVVEDVPTVS